MRRQLLALLPLLLCLVSCATVYSGKLESVRVSSSPSGASAALVCVDGTRRTGLTPVTWTIPRRTGDCTLDVAKEGFGTEARKLQEGVNRAYWINFVTAPLVPAGVAGFTGVLFSKADAQSRTFGAACLLTAATAWSVDRWDGAWRAHDPNTIDVVLKPKP